MCPEHLWKTVSRLALSGLLTCAMAACNDDSGGGEAAAGGEAGAGGATGGAGGEGAGGAAGMGGEAGQGGEGGAQPLAESIKGQVRFKGARRIANDLVDALELPREALCNELGLYDCVSEVHLVNLGGMEPYKLLIRKPLEVAPATAPMSMDRVALAACTERWRRDQADLSSGVLAQELPDAPDAAWLEARGREMIERLLRREVEGPELEALVTLHPALAAEGGTTGDWLVLSCFTVATSVEALFY